MTKETGTAAELNLHPGDVVEFFSPPYTVARAEEIETDIFGESVWLDLPGFRSGVFTNEILRIVSRASCAEDQPPATPKTWGEMTDEEKGALLLAEHRGKVVEVQGTDPDIWVQCLTEDVQDDWIVRVRPEPKRDTVTIYGAPSKHIQWCLDQCGIDTHRITFDVIDGKPDCASIRMEEL